MKGFGKKLVLYYHRINNIKFDPFDLCVTAQNFEEQMKYLREKHEIVRFEDDCKSENLSIVVTFDDGYEDNYKNALPILEKYNIPATFFISTGHVDDEKIMWWDELFELIVGHNHLEVIEINDKELGCAWKTDTYNLKLNCYFAIHKLMNHYISIDKREEWMEQLRRQIGKFEYLEDYNLMNRNEIKLLSKSKLVTIGGHTVSHCSLGKCTREVQEYEIKHNIEELEKIVSKKISVFSYPFGTEGKDVNNDTLTICEKCGIVKAATTTHRIWKQDDDRLLIPRCEVKNWNLSRFKEMIHTYIEG